MERFKSVDQAKVGLLILVVAELFGGALDFGFRLAPQLLANQWADRLFGVASFLTSMMAVIGLVVFVAALKPAEQLLGWLAVSVLTAEASLSLVVSVVPLGEGGWRWASIGDLLLFDVGAVALLMTCAVVVRGLVAWLIPVAGVFSALCVASGAWSLVRILNDEHFADTPEDQKAARLLLSLLIFGGFVAVPAIAWVGLGRLSAPMERKPGW